MPSTTTAVSHEIAWCNKYFTNQRFARLELFHWFAGLAAWCIGAGNHRGIIFSVRSLKVYKPYSYEGANLYSVAFFIRIRKYIK